MFKPGSIRKIQVKNFVTYTHAELYPGPQLNLIIGPNGTGKSTMVAAIILGLGGNPRIVGRGSKVGEYVKHNCTDASISIHLQDNRNDKYIHIVREFNIHSKTCWKLNGKAANSNDVLQVIKDFNIQINNLCQFLPQDRVQEFAKLNKQELLKETQVALCRTDLVEKLQCLIESREQHKVLVENVETLEKKLRDAQEANERLEGRVQNYGRKKKYMQQIENINRKIAWLKYEEEHAKVMEVKQDKIKATEVYEKHKNAVKPMEKEIANSKGSVLEMQQNNAKLTQTIRSHEAGIQNYIERVESLGVSINDVKNDMDAKLDEIEYKQKEIETSIVKLNDMKTTHRNLLRDCDTAKQTQVKLNADIRNLMGESRHIEDKRDDISQQKQNVLAEIRALDHEVNRLENVQQQRLQRLQNTDADAHNAVLWLRNNKHLFKGEIFEPIMLMVNILDPKHAVYVENCIPMRDRLAFTCVNKEDMNMLIRCLREKKNLTINVVHSGNEGANRFQPNIPIEQLRRYGFYTYVHSLFTAPDPIMRYLCKTYQLHNIPVGNQTTNSCYEQVPAQIRTFFSDKYRYSITISKYSGEKSTRQTEVRSDGGLSVSLDVVKLEQLKGKSQELQRNITNLDSEFHTLNLQLKKVEQDAAAMRASLRKSSDIAQQAQALDSRIKQMVRKIESMQEGSIGEEGIKEEAEKKIAKLVQKIRETQETIKNTFKPIVSLMKQSGLVAVQIGKAREHVAYLENKINDNRQLYRDAEDTLNRIKEEYSNRVSEAKGMLHKAKNLSKGFTPDDAGFNEFRPAFDNLSLDVEQLEAEKERVTLRIDCLSTADDEELREYEERIQLIERLQNDIGRSNVDLNKITSKMATLREDWLDPLNELLTKINAKFSECFDRMGCAGEVAVCAGVNDQDYAQYGISIKVTYRSGEPLQELNRAVQSGGERAVATAVYVLSLQELTPVPFRCVDEINQGMDEANERRIFDVLMDACGQRDTAQYFLVTPKLIPNLQYSKSTTVHVIHNGPFIVQDCKWSFSTFCNPKGLHI